MEGHVMMEWMVILFFGLPVTLSWILTPWVRRLAPLVGAIDMPNERKVHTEPMPRLGGVAVYSSFFLSLLALSFAGGEFRPLSSFEPWKMTALLASLGGVLALGIADDIRPLRPSIKFMVQVVISLLLYAGGFRISFVTDLVGLEPMSVGILDIPLTVLWIVGVTNAFNLIDGLDGLAAGVGVIASMTIAGVSFINGDFTVSLIAAALAGSLTGFLKYNFNPARIFLGDSGSLFVGVLLAVLSIQSSTKGSTAFAIAVPILTLGLPIMDTVVAMLRRFLQSFLPEQPASKPALKRLASMFLPDRRHIHHQLVSLGLSHRKVVMILYLISMSFGAGAFLVTVSNNVGASLVLLCVGFATVVGLRQLHYREMAILRNGILLPIYERPVWNRALFVGFLDTAWIALAFVAAYAILPPEEIPGRPYPGFRTLLPFVCSLKLVLLFALGLYRGTSRIAGVGDFLRTLKAVMLASAISGTVLLTLPLTRDYVSLPFLLLEFYFLLTLAVLVRTSFPVLQYLFTRDRAGNQRVLIYGATSDGLLLLQKIISTPSMQMQPIGFLDDNPGLAGKYVNGYPVYGSHWHLRSLLKKFPVDQIILSENDVKPENLSRLRMIASEHGIPVKRPVFRIEDLPIHPKSARRQSFRKEEVDVEAPV